jgi:hypothetical protein
MGQSNFENCFDKTPAPYLDLPTENVMQFRSFF